MGYFRQAIKGVSWMGALRVSTRAIAFVKIAILARLLTPEQFGIFGVAAIVLAFLEILTETGVNIFFIQEEGKLKDYLNTAWVVSIVRGILISLVLLLGAPIIASFFKSPEAKSLILFIAIVPFIKGFINPAIVKYQKELKFNKEFLLRFCTFFVDALVAVLFALVTKEAVSLIWGFIAGGILEVVLSFIIFKPTPRLTFEYDKLKRVINRGKWITGAGVFKYFFEQGDDIVVGRLLNTNFLGLYQMAYKISTLPITEVAEVFVKVTFPVYVKISEDTKRLKRAFLKTTATVTLLVMPIGLILFFFPTEVILFVLGQNWLPAVPVLKILSIFGTISAISNSSHSLFIAVKKQEYVTAITFVSIFAMALFIIPLVGAYGIVGAGIAATIGLVASLPFTIYYSWKVISKP